MGHHLSMINTKKWITIVEVENFKNTVDLILSEDEKNALIESLANFPEQGDIIPRTGGLRKIRFAGKQKGKRGGIRVIYYFYNASMPIFLLSAYAKNVQTNLTASQEKQLVKLVKELKLSCKQPLKKTP